MNEQEGGVQSQLNTESGLPDRKELRTGNTSLFKLVLEKSECVQLFIICRAQEWNISS